MLAAPIRSVLAVLRSRCHSTFALSRPGSQPNLNAAVFVSTLFRVI